MRGCGGLDRGVPGSTSPGWHIPTRVPAEGAASCRDACLSQAPEAAVAVVILQLSARGRKTLLGQRACDPPCGLPHSALLSPVGTRSHNLTVSPTDSCDRKHSSGDTGLDFFF